MWKILLVLIAILLLVTGCGSEQPKKPKEPPKQTIVFNMDGKTFIEKYNALAKDNVKIKDPKIEKKKKVVYSCRFENKTEIMIVEEDNRIQNVSTFTFLPFDEKLFNAVHEPIVGVLNPEHPRKMAIVLGLYLHGVKNFQDSTTQGNVHYDTKESNGVITVRITPAK